MRGAISQLQFERIKIKHAAVRKQIAQGHKRLDADPCDRLGRTIVDHGRTRLEMLEWTIRILGIDTAELFAGEQKQRVVGHNVLV